MPIVNSASVNPGVVINNIIALLKTHQAALYELEKKHEWTSSLVIADLTGIGIDAATAQAVLNAVADAHNEYVNYALGLPANLPATGYQYGASQIALIGPV